MNILRINNTLIVTLDDGTQFKTETCTDDFMQEVMSKLYDTEALIRLFNPEYGKIKNLVDGVEDSQYITRRGNSLYIDSVSKLTVPQDFAEAFIQAEREGDKDKITAYLNFWTLLSLNPDSRVRDNIFWFLKRWGMVISKSGLVVGYRNVDIKQEGGKYPSKLVAFVTREWAYVRYKLKKNPANYTVLVDTYGEYARTTTEGAKSSLNIEVGNLATLYNDIITSKGTIAPIYTDHYSHKFEIKIGQVVQMERMTCDAEQEHDCSRGLHVGGKDWLTKNYFGGTGLRVLVNPADIVAVPTQSDYGKMRTCAYYPINVIEYDADGHVIDDDIESGFEDDFIDQICYTGEKNEHDPNQYVLNIPDTPEFGREDVMESLRQIAIRNGRR